MARNLALDFLKKKNVIYTALNLMRSIRSWCRTWRLSPEEQVISKEMVRKIEGAINVLPARYRLIFKMGEGRRL